MLQTTQGHQIIQTATGQQIVVQSLPAGQQIQVKLKEFWTFTYIHIYETAYRDSDGQTFWVWAVRCEILLNCFNRVTDNRLKLRFKEGNKKVKWYLHDIGHRCVGNLMKLYFQNANLIWRTTIHRFYKYT